MRLRAISALILVMLVMALAPWSSAAGAPAESDPEQFVRGLGEEVLGIIQTSRLDEEERRQSYQRLFERSFAVERMARFALGRHWRRLSEPQRARYVGIFRNYVVQLYADKFSEYSGEKFAVVGRTAKNRDQWRVPARIVRPDGPNVSLVFVLEKPEDRFIIVDVVAEGASLLITKRSEFDSVIDRKGIGGFLDDLQRLTEKMARLWNAAPSILGG